MSPHFDPRSYPYVWEAHVANARAQVDEIVRRAKKRGEWLSVDGHEMIFVGINTEDLSPVWVPRELLFQHVLFLGHPGSGKTARLAALIAQLIRSRNCTVVIVDLKGERGMFQGVREECYYNGIRFRWLTNRIGLPSFAYNPLSQSHIPWRSMNQRVQPTMRALGTSYGETYGGAWFASAMETFLNNLLTYYKTSIYSFKDLAKFCADPNLYTSADKRLGGKDDWSNAKHLHNEFFRLAGVEPLNVTRDSKNYSQEVFDNAVDVSQLYSEPQVLYLYLSSIGEETTCRNIAKLLLYGLLEVADLLSTVRQKGDSVNSVPVFFIVDEFEELVSNTFLPALAMARSLGLGCILCLQTLHQLSLGDKDLTETIISTTSYKHIFSAPDLFTKNYLVNTSGEKEELRATWEQEVSSRSHSIAAKRFSLKYALPRGVLFDHPKVKIQSVKTPRLSMDEVMRISADQFSSLLNLSSDKGPTKFDGRWVPVWSGYHIDQATYQRRENEPFPCSEPGTILVRPFSEYDLRYETPPPATTGPIVAQPVSQSAGQPAAGLSVEEVLRRLRGGKP